jgi:hypothetical protein
LHICKAARWRWLALAARKVSASRPIMFFFNTGIFFLDY